MPFGHFESAPDGIDNTTQIPSIFTFQTHPYLADGQFAVGPFAGLSAVNNAVHSSEINLLAAAQLSQKTLGIDSEVYIGTFLQNAADPRLRLPPGQPVKPSEWLRQVAPDVIQAELEDQIPAPGTGTYPDLQPTLFTYNGLVFSPDTNNPDDNDLLVPPKIYSLDTPVPVPADATVLDVPTEGISVDSTTLPTGILPEGGYKTTSLRGLYFSAPYLHDGGAAVRAGSLQVNSDGSFNIVDPTGLGLTGTLSQSIPADPASSLRALLDEELRTQVIAANKANPALVRSNLDGTGHEFYVGREKQTDLINFLLALDDDPGRF
ncbi:hypothetical protein [Fischerella thermalis]|uniref:hypothetical protein n=1 Tax=Fischerella thermalis TaxID=372787 RepID=UPI000E0C2E31|nr:hypothetical protein [Fischerella thermalis]RDH47994.1 hypothetical protein CA946_17615 [Fischerella thermalis 111/344/542]